MGTNSELFYFVNLFLEVLKVTNFLTNNNNGYYCQEFPKNVLTNCMISWNEVFESSKMYSYKIHDMKI